MNYEQLRADISGGKIAPLYLFTGDEEYLIEYCIGEIKKALIEQWSEMMNFKSYSEIPEVSEASDFLETLPVMSERKLLVFRRCNLFGNIKNKAQWEEVFSSIAPYNCVIVWDTPLEKGKRSTGLRKVIETQGTVVDFALRSEVQLRGWVIKNANASGKNIDAKNASYLATSLGRKMQAIKTELGKIIAFTKGDTITREDIDSVIIKPAEENVFNFIDAIFDGKRELCYNILHKLRNLRQDPASIISVLATQLLSIYKAKTYLLSGLTLPQAAKELGGGFIAEKSVRKAEKIKVENIERLISLCREGDGAIKQGRMSGWSALESIIAEYKFY